MRPVVRAGLKLRRQRLISRLDARVLAQPDQRGLPPILRHLIVEQRPDAAENHLRRVEVRQVVLLRQRRVLQHVIGRLDHDAQILREVRVLLRGELPPQAVYYRLCVGLEPRGAIHGKLRHLVVQTGDAPSRSAFSLVSRLQLEQRLRVSIAVRNP